MRILGIDYGRRRIGLALSDETGTLASPLPTFTRGRSEKQDLVALASLIEQHGATSVVVGLPLNMDGTRGEMAQEAETFSERLRDRTGLPIDMFDERLSSDEAERVLLEADLPRRRRKELRDGLAAVVILQGYLNRQSPG